MKVFAIIVIILSVSACNTAPRYVPEPFTVSLDSPSIPLGTIEVQFDRFMSLGGLRKREVTVSYFPREDAVCLMYREDFMTYYQFWSNEGRNAFFIALENYKEDFEARNLARNSRQTARKYGTIEGFLIWQLTRFTIQASAQSTIDLGHQFRGHAPYFTINQREAHYLDPMSRDNNRSSPHIMMFFTRAQADNLAALFDRQLLQGLRAAHIGTINQTLLDIDIYDVFEAEAETDFYTEE